MMGLGDGWVTGHGLRPAQELKMLGNGVVPQQAALALRLLLGLPAAGVDAGGVLLPTPSANDTTGAEPRSQRGARSAGGPMLRDLPHLLPTPRAAEAEHSVRAVPAKPGQQQGLAETVNTLHLLPAPKAGDGERGRDLPRMRADEKSRELSTAAAFMGIADA